ncbi:AAA family ATPase [Amycolatopsis sp. GM8]|uniref:AAA family ATPase n=1 Tax=Amycolatopsis sp. GM8 TaxID=2896530 RepID=UPI001F1BE80D|nr:AAA family ATPase [Amycolatopsis sp. GM8]
MAVRQPEDIFTPKTIVSREMFARRNEADLHGNPGLQDNLCDALRDRGGQVLIFGDTGVGKSSLIKYAAEDESLEAVTIECLSSKSYADLIEDGLRKLIDVREVKKTSTASASAEVEASGKAPFLLTLKGKLQGKYDRGREFEIVSKPPLDALLEAMKATGNKLLIFDNFQNISNQVDRSLIAQTMEFLADKSNETGDIKAVVIGIAEDASSLLGGSGSFRRRTTEVGVPRMPDDEIVEILKRGFMKLEISISDPIIRQLVFYSDGFPYFGHLLGLQVSRAARREGVDSVTVEMVETALQRAVKDVDRSYRERTRKAFEVGGQVQPRRRILEILSISDKREWRSADVISAYEDRFERRSDYAFLHTSLAQLIDKKHGSVLARSGARNSYIYRFSDPQMRPYLRLTAFRRHLT